MGDLVAAKSDDDDIVLPKSLFCQMEESAHGRAPPQEAIGPSPCLPCLSRAKPRGAWRRDAIRLKHYSYRTEQAYVGWIKRYILLHGVRHPPETVS